MIHVDNDMYMYDTCMGSDINDTCMCNDINDTCMCNDVYDTCIWLVGSCSCWSSGL